MTTKQLRQLRQIAIVLKRLKRFQRTKSMLGKHRRWSPFQILISAILSARAKDEATEAVSKRLFKSYPDAQRLAKAPIKKVIKLVKSIGFYNIKARNITKTAKMLATKYDGKVPKTFGELIALPGVGRKVANCVLAYAFKKPVIPVDTHVNRVANRLGWVKTKKPEQTEKVLERLVPKRHWLLVNELFVTHGQAICVPISPFCSKCPVFKWCRRTGVERHR